MHKYIFLILNNCKYIYINVVSLIIIWQNTSPFWTIIRGATVDGVQSSSYMLQPNWHLTIKLIGKSLHFNFNHKTTCYKVKIKITTLVVFVQKSKEYKWRGTPKFNNFKKITIKTLSYGIVYEYVIVYRDSIYILYYCLGQNSSLDSHPFEFN